VRPRRKPQARARRRLLGNRGDCDIDRRDAAMLPAWYMWGIAPQTSWSRSFARRAAMVLRQRMDDHGLERVLLRSKSSQETPPLCIVVGGHHNPQRPRQVGTRPFV